MKISKQLLGLQNILSAKLTAIHHIIIIITENFPNKPAFIFTDSLNFLYLIHTQSQHPTLHNNHHDKIILTLITNMLHATYIPP
jgi:hypothetical protein